ncbi:Rieske domain protein, partial [Globisporangium splendens]
MAIRLSRMRSAAALRLQSRALCSCSGNSSASSGSTPSAAPRVLCSVAELLALDGKALKFPLVIDSEQPPSVDANAEAPPAAKPRTSKARGLATGFVLFCADSQQPRAFVNSCPHARLELDFDDSDFFCEGFIQCKVHGAFFDPHTGMCLQGPTGARRSSGRQLKSIPVSQQLFGLLLYHVKAPNIVLCLFFMGKPKSLSSLEVRTEAGNVVLLGSSRTTTRNAATDSNTLEDEERLSAYRLEKQKELASALASRTDDVLSMQQMLHEKTMARMQKYSAAKPKPGAKA